ncbi:MAG: flavodoxin family protein [Thermoleophilia bacterium]|nr:flavodoxin family protein [Thermoleophilia bacterium]
MVRVLGILGSPRLAGNTDKLLDRALAGAKDAGAEVEKISLCDLDISGCIECNDCYETGSCTIGDEMDIVYAALERADRVILASPMFFMGVTAQAKAVIDRCQCYWALKYILKERFPRLENAPARYGSFIGVGGTSGEKLFEGTMLTLKYFFDAIDAKPAEEFYVLVRGVDDKDDVLKRDEALHAAYESGKSLAQLK